MALCTEKIISATSKSHLSVFHILKNFDRFILNLFVHLFLHLPKLRIAQAQFLRRKLVLSISVL